MTLHRLQQMFGPGSVSNCSGAINMNELMMMRRPAINGRLQLPFRKDEEVSHYVNFGAGTTGTRFLFSIMCNYFDVSGTHYSSYCHGKNSRRKEHKVSAWYENLKGICVSGNPIRSKVEKKVFSHLVQDMLLEQHGGSYWTDTPVAETFVDILGLRPWKFALATYRNPRDWAARRSAEHSQNLICHPTLWNSSLVLHPFDIIGCLEAREFVKDAFVPFSKIHSANLEHAFIKMNTVNAYQALARNIPFVPICVFDTDQSAMDSIISLLSRNGMQPGKKMVAV